MNILGFRIDSNLKIALENNLDYNITLVSSTLDILDCIKSKKFDAIILDDLQIREDAFISLIKKVAELQKKAIIIALGETSNLNVVAGSLKAGAYDYILKPISHKEVMTILEKSLKDSKISVERIDKNKSTGDKLIGQSKEILEVYKTIGKVSKNLVPVLIVGERGTGKSSVAKSIHQFSDNKQNPFVTINCLSLGNEFIERKLFGYEKGAFQGALFSQAGDLEKINNGTLYLGNIEALNLDLQSKLCYYLQQGEYFPIGSAIPVKSSARILASTSDNLDALINQGKFIQELYSKLRVLEVIIPPLRERKNDIPFIVDHYISQVNLELETSIKGVSKPAIKKLLRYDWPGNVNELKNSIKSAVAISRGPSILLEDLPSNILGTSITKNKSDDQNIILKDWIKAELHNLKKESNHDYYNRVISKIEKELISQVLEITNGKKVDAAELLGITRNTLRTKMSIFEIE
ncbi:MAG: sigma-54-dependent transcriptional regulator [Fusobacteriaceae bacterium]